MVIHDVVCGAGHRREVVLRSMHDSVPDCAVCGAGVRKLPSRLNIGGAADTGPSREAMPRSWRGVRGGDAETVRHWHGLAEKREKLEEKHPELGGDRRPVLAHEGIFRDRPLRAGDDIGRAVGDALARAKGSGA
ncbi:transcriptional regulator [Kineococcus rhizosphaerae]|uniref:Uncharacterized protein n=1 Tax=Kineococcus rhizosphaerae TaxID=559628 RepID=A0A2T0QX87_9ACTN|nr:transcriptional regulator [Kineococcus rhizosphaerae]PRY10492.1 hypothetical protein CLV37_11645 [Kineococcus rhizosphaerae]